MAHVRDFPVYPAEASQFHKMAWCFLSDMGFELINDPSLKHGRFSASSAVYRSEQGLYISVGFESGDSNSAMIFCGRKWSGQRGTLCFSNNYSVLAKRFEMDVPATYKLGYGDEPPKTMEKMFDDLKKTLPKIQDRVTLTDIMSIEEGTNGARNIAAGKLGLNFMEEVEISSFG
ncbi:hypothetical protein [Microbulbifer sp. A4B17]|uniref:hypothetical protein n=1 Tax=Microbulbifer sp. A4B17 TaxID=359370 RepID=UPI0013003523|nr:hypothetical protein [Microbulbifer sp. A4B17]